MDTLGVKRLSLREWFLAARPKTLPTAIIPFLAGTMLACASGYQITWDLMFFAWLSSVCIQVGTNFVNDAFDYKRKADSTASLGPQRATREGLLSGQLSFDAVRNMGLFFFAAALLAGVPLVLKGGAFVGIILIISALAGYLYTGGPFPLAYHGLGDLFVLLFYGGVATNAAYWLQTDTVDQKSVLLSFQIGCLCTSMIAINNLRDVHEDVKALKKTLPVRFGVFFGKLEVTAMIIFPLLLNLKWEWPFVAWLPLLSAPLAFKIVSTVWKAPQGEGYNKLLATSGGNMLTFCLLQAIGFRLS